MAFITLANTKKIIYNTKIKELDLTGEVYKIPIYFFGKYEKNQLLAIQELLKNPERFFTDIYIPFQTEDTYTFVYEGQKPAYHKVNNCEKLNATFENFSIPKEIQERGIGVVIEFRKWFEEVKHLLEKPEIFVMRLQARWGIITNPKAINIGNSGITKFESYNIDELVNIIDLQIKEAGRFYHESKKNKVILKNYSKFTYLAYSTEDLRNNTTGYAQEEIKEFLRLYDEKFKKPLKQNLIEYYKLKLNPEIDLSGDLLKGVGFTACVDCHSVNYYEHFKEELEKDLK